MCPPRHGSQLRTGEAKPLTPVLIAEASLDELIVHGDSVKSRGTQRRCIMLRIAILIMLCNCAWRSRLGYQSMRSGPRRTDSANSLAHHLSEPSPAILADPQASGWTLTTNELPCHASTTNMTGIGSLRRLIQYCNVCTRDF